MIRCDNLLREYLDWTNKDGADLTEAARWLRLHTDSKDTARRIWPDFSKGVQDYFRSDDVSESLQDEFYADERTEAGDRRPSGSVMNEVYSTEAPELTEAFKAGNRAINQLCNHPTAKSIAAHRKQNAYNIKRFIGGKLSEWQCPYLNAAESVVGFEIKEDKIVFNVEVPFKHSDYEDQLNLF